MDKILPGEPGADWINELSDDQCLEVFWLYVESPDEFFASHPKALLGQALRYALRKIATGPTTTPGPP